jgi:hypothetical protein
MSGYQLTRIRTLRATHKWKNPTAIIQVQLLGRPDAGEFVAKMRKPADIICQFLLFVDL